MDIISSLIASSLGILGIFLGAYLTNKNAKSQEHLKFLANCYAEVFTEYITNIPFDTLDKVKKIRVAIEKTKLFCSDESYKILEELSEAITDKTNHQQRCSLLINQLRKSAKEDLDKFKKP